jgi:hypothetical protein
MGKYIKTLALAIVLFSFNNRAQSQCNEPMLTICDDNYDMRMEQDQLNFANGLTGCLSKWLMALADFYAPDKFGEVAGPMKQLSDLPGLFDAAFAAQDCAAATDETFWANWEGNMRQWHNCEADPTMGNCPDRALRKLY